MDTMDNAFDGSSERLLPRLTTSAAHAVPLVLGAAVAARIIGLVTNIPAMSTAVNLIAMIVTVLFFFHAVTPQMCLRCMHNTPLDPEYAIARNKWVLAVAHVRPRTWLLVLAAAVVVRVGGWWVAPDLYLFRILLDLTWMGSSWALWTHHRLQPWCPYCRPWEDGGEHERVPDPDPTSANRIGR